jgi:hypothetical protein
MIGLRPQSRLGTEVIVDRKHQHSHNTGTTRANSCCHPTRNVVLPDAMRKRGTLPAALAGCRRRSRAIGESHQDDRTRPLDSSFPRLTRFTELLLFRNDPRGKCFAETIYPIARSLSLSESRWTACSHGVSPAPSQGGLTSQRKKLGELL